MGPESKFFYEHIKYLYLIFIWYLYQIKVWNIVVFPFVFTFFLPNRGRYLQDYRLISFLSHTLSMLLSLCLLSCVLSFPSSITTTCLLWSSCLLAFSLIFILSDFTLLLLPWVLHLLLHHPRLLCFLMSFSAESSHKLLQLIHTATRSSHHYSLYKLNWKERQRDQERLRVFICVCLCMREMDN